MGSGPGQHRENHTGNRQQLRLSKKHMWKAKPAKIVGHQKRGTPTRRREALSSITETGGAKE